MGYSSKEKPSTENDDEPLGLGIHYFQTKPHTLFKPSLPSWWQMCFFDDSQSHVLWWAKRWDDTLTRWFPFLQIHTGLEWKWQWPYWVGNTGHKNNNNYIYVIHMFIQLKQILGICHILENSLEAEDFNLQSACLLISITTHPWLRELLYPRPFRCWFDTLHSFLVGHLFNSHFCFFRGSCLCHPRTT